MKRYTSIGDLLQDYRSFHHMSQADFAVNLNVDVRTVQRWERNITLIKPEKEKDIVYETLLPYQLIRNLNAERPIPTLYDFDLRKYATSELSKNLPMTYWLKEAFSHNSERLQTISSDDNLEWLMRYIDKYGSVLRKVDKRLILEAARILPELNFIIRDDSGYYAGHSIVFPVKSEFLELLKSEELGEIKLEYTDLLNYKNTDRPVFLSYTVSVDTNENIFYYAARYFDFFKQLDDKDYIYSSLTTRNDTLEFNKSMGLNQEWERPVQKNGKEFTARLFTGNFKSFLNKE